MASWVSAVEIRPLFSMDTRRTKYRESTELAILGNHVFSNLQKTHCRESFNSVPGHHVFNHVQALKLNHVLAFQKSRPVVPLQQNSRGL